MRPSVLGWNDSRGVIISVLAISHYLCPLPQLPTPVAYSVPTNGNETWVLNKQQESVIQAVEMRVLRRIAEKRMVDSVRNVEIREELKLEGVLEKVKRSQVRMGQALAEMGPERLVRSRWK